MSQVWGPQNPLSAQLHAAKYRSRNETFREAMSRIASALSDDDVHFSSFRDALLNLRFLPGGRIQAAVGSARMVTPYNCFVSGKIEDSYTEGSGSIMHRAAEAATTMRLGGGIGYDFSTLRPRGAPIKKLGSTSSGPVPFMEIFDAVCRATCSSGHRRGAQMGVLRVDHPDIEEFIRAKQNSSFLTGFNISVAVTDRFMKDVENDAEFPLIWQDQVWRTVRARDLWNTLMRSTYDWAEPGVLFIDRINSFNNLAYCETIAATNPCGEQPLPPFGACLLGSFNLPKYLSSEGPGEVWKFNWAQFFADIPVVVRAMDNVVDVARYPLYEQEKEAQTKRRMGLGVTGLANCVEATGGPYGSPAFIHKMGGILSGLKNQAYLASTELAAEKGSFPAYNKERYLRSRFVATLGEKTISAIEESGIRNSHLLSIAPTGTISVAADNVSSGIEPVFAYEVERTLIEEDGPKTYLLRDYGVERLSTKGKVAADCTVGDHLAVLACAAEHMDSAVSKTCNIPKNYPFDEFRNVYMQAWKVGAKGCTTYRVGGKRGAILQSVDEPIPTEALSCEVDEVTGLRSCE